MKALPRSDHVSGHYREVRIYRDDLERIIGLLRGTNLNIKITDHTFEYETLEEVQKANGNTPRVLKLEGYDSWGVSPISLSMSDRVWYLSSLTKHTYEPAREIETILKTPQSRLERTPIAGMAAIGGFLAYSTRWLDTNPAWISTTVLGAALVLTLCAGSIWLYTHFRTGVVLNYKHEAGFFARNRDKIIVAVFTALFLAALQIIIWLLTGHSIQLVGP